MKVRCPNLADTVVLELFNRTVERMGGKRLSAEDVANREPYKSSLTDSERSAYHRALGHFDEIGDAGLVFEHVDRFERVRESLSAVDIPRPPEGGAAISVNAPWSEKLRDAAVMEDAVTIGGYYLEGGLREFDAWARQMRVELPGAADQELKDIYGRASYLLEGVNNAPEVVAARQALVREMMRYNKPGPSGGVKMWFMRVSRDLLLSAAGLSFVGAALMGYTIFGRPSYAFYGPMKWYVAFACVLSAYVLAKMSRWLIPVSAGLLLSGFTELTAKMHRTQWVPYNWATLLLFVAAAAVCLLSVTREARIREAVRFPVGVLSLVAVVLVTALALLLAVGRAVGVAMPSEDLTAYGTRLEPLVTDWVALMRPLDLVDDPNKIDLQRVIEWMSDAATVSAPADADRGEVLRDLKWFRDNRKEVGDVAAARADEIDKLVERLDALTPPEELTSLQSAIKRVWISEAEAARSIPTAVDKAIADLSPGELSQAGDEVGNVLTLPDHPIDVGVPGEALLDPRLRAATRLEASPEGSQSSPWGDLLKGLSAIPLLLPVALCVALGLGSVGSTVYGEDTTDFWEMRADWRALVISCVGFATFLAVGVFLGGFVRGGMEAGERGFPALICAPVYLVLFGIALVVTRVWIKEKASSVLRAIPSAVFIVMASGTVWSLCAGFGLPQPFRWCFSIPF